MNKAGSIQRRLAAAALLWLCAALVGAGFGLVEIFRGQAASILESHLIDDMDHVVAAIEAVPDGTVRLTRALPDSLYDRPYSGRYWQIEVAGRPMLRSRSPTLTHCVWRMMQPIRWLTFAPALTTCG